MLVVLAKHTDYGGTKGNYNTDAHRHTNFNQCKDANNFLGVYLFSLSRMPLRCCLSMNDELKTQKSQPFQDEN